MDGEGIKIIRVGLGKSQAEMAQALSVSRQSYIAWEHDTYKMPAAKLAILMTLAGAETMGEPKETPKQKRERELQEQKLIDYHVAGYRRLRAWPDITNHRKAMAVKAKEGSVIPPIAYAALVAAFPDILTDPDGHYPVSKAQSNLIILGKPGE